MKYLKKLTVPTKAKFIWLQCSEKGTYFHLLITRNELNTGYSLSQQSFLFIESFKSILGQLQAFGIENKKQSKQH